MTETHFRLCTAFEGSRLLASGPLAEVALAVRRAAGSDPGDPILVFDDATGGVVDLDLRGSDDEVLARLAPPADAPAEPAAEGRRGRGRPRLGVVSREVTLLPRHWEWLAAQPGGASVTLRRLVEEARRAGGEQERARTARDAGYRFMSAMAGDLPGFEEATRALFAGDRAGFERQIAGWPDAVRGYAARLAFG